MTQAGLGKSVGAAQAFYCLIHLTVRGFGTIPWSSPMPEFQGLPRVPLTQEAWVGKGNSGLRWAMPAWLVQSSFCRLAQKIPAYTPPFHLQQAVLLVVKSQACTPALQVGGRRSVASNLSDYFMVVPREISQLRISLTMFKLTPLCNRPKASVPWEEQERYYMPFNLIIGTSEQKGGRGGGQLSCQSARVPPGIHQILLGANAGQPSHCTSG